MIAVFGCTRKRFSQVFKDRLMSPGVKGWFYVDECSFVDGKTYRHFSRPEEMRGLELEGYEILWQDGFNLDVNDFISVAKSRIKNNSEEA